MKNPKLIDPAPNWDLTQDDIDAAIQALRTLLLKKPERNLDVGGEETLKHPVSTEFSE